MKKFLFFSLLLSTFNAKAQTTIGFETPLLPAANTYLNGSTLTPSGGNSGFSYSTAYFTNSYDTSFGGYWSGSALSNKLDTASSGFSAQYTSAAYGGYGTSSQYVVCYDAGDIKVRLQGAAVGKTINGMMVTNNSYAFKSMKFGDSFSKKFGGVTGTDADTFVIKAKGWLGGVLKPATAKFYLADFRFTNSASDYIVKNWSWFDLTPLGNVDSIQLELVSSDNGTFGMNTPAYFCMDNFVTDDIVKVNNTLELNSLITPFPNPTTSTLQWLYPQTVSVQIVNMQGRVVLAKNNVQGSIDVQNLSKGTYLLQILDSKNRKAVKVFEKL